MSESTFGPAFNASGFWDEVGLKYVSNPWDREDHGTPWPGGNDGPRGRQGRLSRQQGDGKSAIVMANPSIAPEFSRDERFRRLFTATPKKARIIENLSKILGIKISKIGKITSSKKKSVIIDEKGMQIALKNKGYIHHF